MNILICSAGRRVKVVQYLTDDLNKLGGDVIAADCDSYAPGLYFADSYEIIPRIDDPNYLTSVLKICKKHNISGVLSLIDPELEVHAKNKERFEEIGVKLLLSPLDMIQYCFDKQQTFNYLSNMNILAVPTYSRLHELHSSLEKQLFDFPLIVKPGKGSASIGIETVNNYNELENLFYQDDNLIIQPYYKEREFGIDAYVDMISGDLVDLFIKEKIKMRSGETDKSISVRNDHIESLVKDLIDKTEFLGPIDIDCFEYDGQYYISEINPRFGGGYPHAYEMGCNFMEYIITNLQGQRNEDYDGYQYDESYIMMKYDNVILKKNN